jgi:hypothetical protein
MHDKQQLLAFMNSRPLMVLSTVNSEGKPESAVVGFGQTDAFELVLGTSVHSRKAKNIASKSDVSVVIGWDEKGTLQYEGIARLLEGHDVGTYPEIYYAKNPGARRNKDNSDECYILVKPKWIRFTEVAAKPWRITKFTF